MSRRSRSRSPTRQSAQPATFRPPSSGTTALYGGSSLSPSSPPAFGQLSPGSQNFLNSFFGDNTNGATPVNFGRQSVLAQPATFQPSSTLSLSGRRTIGVTAMSPAPLFGAQLSPTGIQLSPATLEMISGAYACSPQSQPLTFTPSARSNSRSSSPRLL